MVDFTVGDHAKESVRPVFFPRKMMLYNIN